MEIEAEGTKESLQGFQDEITNNPPLLATILDISTENKKIQGFTRFEIVKSLREKTRKTLISPDVSVCDDCITEMNDPGNRRYNYPFINCTNCGPRYSIIMDVPYDRQMTSMADFKLCDSCQAEYTNPLDRRFHAQPNACYDCGPKVQLFDSEKREVPTDNCIRKAVQLLQQGHCVAIKGLGGYHLAVDATNRDAVQKLRRVKNRGAKPFAVMADSTESIRRFADISEGEKKLLTSFQKPVVLLKKNSADSETALSEIAPRNKTIGVMLPYTPLHCLLFQYELKVLVMTSANKKSEPIVIDNEDAFTTLSELADFFLINNRDIYLRSDDSVIRQVCEKTCFLRRSRGYAPTPVVLAKQYPPVLALGGELKNTLCLLNGDKAIISQHIGDLDNPKAHDFFEMTAGHLTKIFDVTPERVAHDLHPDYLSTIHARKHIGVPVVAVQHHHAHIASCMAENHLNEKVIGIALDGTGFGDDGRLWGSEMMVCDYREYQRAAHLSYFPMPGGEVAIKEPWRLGISLLYQAFGKEFPVEKIPLFRNAGVDGKKADFILQMIDKKINSPETSGMGRFFDGISAILGVRETISFEGQAAIELEMIACEEDNLSHYDYSWDEDEMISVDAAMIVKGVVADLLLNEDISVISRKFHTTIIYLYSDLCGVVRDKTGLNKVTLSGGVFQNGILLEGFVKRLEGLGFDVYTHQQVPTNDGGIALGQAIIAAEAEFPDKSDSCVAHHLT